MSRAKLDGAGASAVCACKRPAALMPASHKIIFAPDGVKPVIWLVSRLYWWVRMGPRIGLPRDLPIH